MSSGSASAVSACAAGSVSLPVLAGAGGPPRVARSKASRWRAAVLVLVHLLIIAHVVQWLLTGRTLSPVEPSESIETIKYGYVNAGFIFFAAAVLVTLVLGRFVCGWGCHLVAYQDLCTWLLKKIGIRPKPFRSRLLIFVPLGAALYMFAWPQVYIWLRGMARPPTTAHLMTEEFWRTFPGLGVAVLTVGVCGFLIVYLLGNKGFCTYACPYGAVFGLAEQAAVGRIRVTDACEGCGHCTSVCSSNVRVHEEVRDFGMVVDPGCMKCFDCVTVCPNDALYYGFGRPALRAAKRRIAPPARQRRYDFTWPEELTMAAVFGATLLAFRGLYDLVPFLLALGIGVISAFAAVQALRLVTRPNVRLHVWQLKHRGRLLPAAWCFVGLMCAWGLLTAHSGLVRYRTWRGLALFEQAYADAPPSAAAGMSGSRSPGGAAARSFAHLSFAERWGLVDTVTVNMKLAWLHILAGDAPEAERRLRRVIELQPQHAEPRFLLGNLLTEQRRPAEAVELFAQAAALDPQHARAHFNAGLLSAQLGRLQEAAAAFQHAIDAGLDNAEVRWNLGSALTSLGRQDEAIAQFAKAAELKPGFADAHYNCGVLLLARAKVDRAIAHLEQAVRLAPGDARAHRVLAEALLASGERDAAQYHLDLARRLDRRIELGASAANR